MTTTKTYSKTRAADRKKMAAELEAIALAAGATVTITPEAPVYPGPRTIAFRAKLNGVEVSVSLDGDSRTGAYLANWGSDKRLDPSFGGDVGGPINQYHGRKATTIHPDWEKFKRYIANGLRAATEDGVFIEEAADG